MKLLSLISLIVAFPCLILAIYVFLKRKRDVHRLWAFLNLVLASWGAGLFFVWEAGNSEQALIAWRVAHASIMFISPTLNHLVLVFCKRPQRIILRLSYAIAIIFSLLFLFSNILINQVTPVFGNLFYYKASLWYVFGLSIWAIFASFGFIELWKFIKVSSGIKRIQASYLILGAFLGYFGGILTILPSFGILIYPAGYALVGLYLLVSAYAIFRYQFLDVRIVISNTAIFIAVYTLVLGVPFYLYAIEFKLISLIFMGILATAGPFIYLYFQRRTENRLLQEQRRYQSTLRQASAGMGKIKDLKKLLNMIVYVLTHAIQIEHALVYINDKGQKQYVLGASKNKSGNKQFVDIIEEKSPLVQYLLRNKSLIIFEEIKERSQDNKDLELTEVVQIISSLVGALVVPIFIDQNLVAIIVMGKKESGKIYNEDDIGVFSILANQTALAIENAEFYESMKKTHEQLFQAEKMATIGTMADGLSHQINNRFHSLGFIAGDALDTIHLNQKEISPEKMKEIMTELERAFVRVQDNVLQGGEIVQGLLKYTRKGEAGFAAVDVDAVLKAALEMVQLKIKIYELKIVREYDAATIPKIKGNFTQLQEVFFNLIDNGYDAMMQRKYEKKEASYQATLTVRILKEDHQAQIIFEDNGIGIKEEDMPKIFTPFFTTKLSSKKGTGLGLYVIKKIVEDNHKGQVEMVSKYMHGTQMKLRLPIAIE